MYETHNFRTLFLFFALLPFSFLRQERCETRTIHLPRQARDEPENVSFKRRRPHVIVFSQDPVVVADAVKQVRRTLL